MKKKYEKPQIRMVKLEVEEAVLQACKADGTGRSNVQTGCTVPGNRCSTAGS